MRIGLPSLLLLLLSSRQSCFIAAADGGLYPPGLLPLINKANLLLSSGQFSEASKIYSEAIGTVILVYITASSNFSLAPVQESRTISGRDTNKPYLTTSVKNVTYSPSYPSGNPETVKQWSDYAPRVVRIPLLNYPPCFTSEFV
jgi:hypothetical protein